MSAAGDSDQTVFQRRGRSDRHRVQKRKASEALHAGRYEEKFKECNPNDTEYECHSSSGLCRMMTAEAIMTK